MVVLDRKCKRLAADLPDQVMAEEVVEAQMSMNIDDTVSLDETVTVVG